MGQFESFIGVDFWTALFVLLNTCAIFVVARKFLFTPVHNMIESRQKEIDQMYADAEKAKTDARGLRFEYEAKISGIRQEADRVIKTATESANAMSANIVADARTQAEQIKNRAQNEIEIERNVHPVYRVETVADSVDYVFIKFGDQQLRVVHRGKRQKPQKQYI